MKLQAAPWIGRKLYGRVENFSGQPSDLGPVLTFKVAIPLGSVKKWLPDWAVLAYQVDGDVPPRISLAYEKERVGVLITVPAGAAKGVLKSESIELLSRATIALGAPIAGEGPLPKPEVTIQFRALYSHRLVAFLAEYMGNMAVEFNIKTARSSQRDAFPLEPETGGPDD